MLNLSYPIRLLPILLWTLLIPAPATGEDVDQATFSVEMVRDIPYAQKHSPHPRQHLDLFVPRNTQKPTPVLVFVHGGSWRSGNKTFYLMLGRAFARQGILTAIIGYRLSPEVKHPAHAQDVAQALNWVYRNAAKHNGNPQEIFLCGHSAGGHLTALIALDDRYLQVHDLSPTILRGVIPISGVYRIDSGRWYDLAFPRQGRDQASPIHHTRKDRPPFLVLWAEEEAINLVKQGRDFARSLKKSEVPVKAIEIPNRNHITIIVGAVFPNDPLHRAIVSFIKRTVVPQSRNH